MSELKGRKTPLFECHLEHKAKMVDFAGWQMPIQYEGIMAEHRAVRASVGVFDVSHMGRVDITGKDALKTIQYWITNDASKLDVLQAQYTPFCYEDGGIVDDCIVYRLGEEHYMIVLNASNREKDYNWFMDHIPAGADVKVTHPDEGDRWALMAVQGPNARALLSSLTEKSLMDVPRNGIVMTTAAGIEGCMFACTGYTGEDGFEAFVPAEKAVDFWHALFEAGKKYDIVPVGLGARDTLRMEMKYPLYGNDIDKTTTPIEAGLSWTVKPDKGDFIGKEVLVKQMQEKPSRRLIGFELEERGIPRHGSVIYSADGTEEIGIVTSGGFAPSLNKAIGIGYVPAKPHFAKIGSPLQIGIRNRRLAARVVKTPFYRPQAKS